MRYAAIVHRYAPFHRAGAELATHELLKGLMAKGHEVDVYLPRHPTSEITPYDGLNVIPFDEHKPWSEYAALFSHLDEAPFTSAIAQANGLPFVHVVHNEKPDTRQLVAELPTALNVMNTHWVAKALEPLAGSTPSVVVHPPVNPVDYATTPGKSVTLINCAADKGGAIFARMADMLPRQRFLGVIGAYGEQITSDLVNTSYIGHTQDMKSVYGKTRILVMPSSYESYGRTAVEAMASGIPVIAAPTLGLREALGSAGIYVPRYDVNGYLRAISNLNDPRTYARASETALARSAQIERTRQPEIDTFVDAIENL